MAAKRILPLAVLLGGTLLLGACGHMPLTSMAKLARIDFETSDLAQWSAAVRLPPSLRPLSQKVFLRVIVKRGRTQEVREALLREVPAAGELNSESGPDGRIHVFRIDPADAARLTAFRSDLLAQKSTGQGGSLTISVAPTVCKVGALPASPILVTTYLKTAETGQFVPLTRDIDIRSELPAGTVQAIPACET